VVGPPVIIVDPGAAPGGGRGPGLFAPPGVIVEYPNAPRFTDEDVGELENLMLVLAGLAGGCTPGVGEAMDTAVLLWPGSTTFDRCLAGGSLIANFATAGFLPNFGAGRVVLRGREHHIISTRIHRGIQAHPVLSGSYRRRDPRFVARAADSAAHRGYQAWHRSLDLEVVQWLAVNPTASVAQFEAYLRWRYARPDLFVRFPLGF
jgi:hypothetical protein